MPADTPPEAWSEGGRTGIGAGSTPGPVDDSAREAARAYYSQAVDEARRCLAESVAGPDDIDVGLPLGAGWSDGPPTWAAGR